MKPEPEHKLDKRIVNVWRISAIVVAGIPAFFVILTGIILMATAVLPVWAGLLICVLGIAFALIFILVLPSIRYARWRYELSDDELDLSRGIFWRTRTIVPFIRVQHVDTSQGPIMRAFGLASVDVTTAGGPVTIPGLALQEASDLRDRIAYLVRIAREDV